MGRLLREGDSMSVGEEPTNTSMPTPQKSPSDRRFTGSGEHIYTVTIPGWHGEESGDTHYRFDDTSLKSELRPVITHSAGFSGLSHRNRSLSLQFDPAMCELRVVFGTNQYGETIVPTPCDIQRALKDAEIPGIAVVPTENTGPVGLVFRAVPLLEAEWRDERSPSDIVSQTLGEILGPLRAPSWNDSSKKGVSTAVSSTRKEKLRDREANGASDLATDSADSGDEVAAQTSEIVEENTPRILESFSINSDLEHSFNYAPDIPDDILFWSRSKRSLGLTPETVIGDDDRKLVSAFVDIREPPWCSICRLNIQVKLNNGKKLNGTGTGWLVAPGVIVTAGHCLFARVSKLQKKFRWINSIQVIPGYNHPGKYKDSFKVTSRDCHVPPEYIATKHPAYDFGLIIFRPDSYRVPYHFKLIEEKYDEVVPYSRQPITITGFPSRMKVQGGMYWHGRDVKNLNSSMVQYNADTSEGQSGAPAYVFSKSSETLRVVGIHTYGTDVKNSWNSAHRINNQVRKFIRTTMDKFGLPSSEI